MSPWSPNPPPPPVLPPLCCFPPYHGALTTLYSIVAQVLPFFGGYFCDKVIAIALFTLATALLMLTLVGAVLVTLLIVRL